MWAAGVSNFVYVSIVGIEDIPYSYYDHKLTAERAVEESEVPSTVLRSTQFHPFVHEMLGMVARLPVWLLPTRMKLQPIDVGEVADRLVEAATPEPGGRLESIRGPEVRTVGNWPARTGRREDRGGRSSACRSPPQRSFWSARFLPADQGTITLTGSCPGVWEDWLEEKYGGVSSS